VYAGLRDPMESLELAPGTEQTAIRVLEVFRRLLAEVIETQEKTFSGIQQYIDSVNDFLEGKSLVVDPNLPRIGRTSVRIDFEDGSSVSGLHALSSGERQIVTLTYASTHMNEQNVILIDEPELSLHIDWQRKLLSRMSAQLGERQIIACTHSPMIAADYDQQLRELILEHTKETPTIPDDSSEDEEIPF
jgi:predicted ATP-dependent endonuclease of OLD family